MDKTVLFILVSDRMPDCDCRQTTAILQNAASQLAPLAQKISELQLASDAAFETDVHATPPWSFSAPTLQGFVLLFFTISFVALACMATFMVNSISGSRSAGITFVSFLLVAVLLFVVIRRYA